MKKSKPYATYIQAFSLVILTICIPFVVDAQINQKQDEAKQLASQGIMFREYYQFSKEVELKQLILNSTIDLMEYAKQDPVPMGYWEDYYRYVNMYNDLEESRLESLASTLGYNLTELEEADFYGYLDWVSNETGLWHEVYVWAQNISERSFEVQAEIASLNQIKSVLILIGAITQIISIILRWAPIEEYHI